MLPHFILQGQYWNLEFGGVTCHLPDCAGLRQIAVLLEHPGEPLSSAVLAAVGTGHWPGVDGERARVNVTRTIHAALERIAALDPALAFHLRHCLRIGMVNRYDPARDSPAAEGPAASRGVDRRASERII